MTTRRERVILDLQDNFTTGMLRAAAATKLLDRELSHMSGSSSRSLDASSRSIDRYSGRLRLLADIGMSLGPAFVPITGVAIPAITSLASSLGFAAAATGGVVFAFQGFGDALDAVNKYNLEPTEANLEKMRLAMSQISPEARELVSQLAGLKPVFADLRAAGGEDLFPAIGESIDNLLNLLPQAERILREMSSTVGDVLVDASESLTSDRWADFFRFLETEARPTLTDTAKAAGDLGHGLAELWMAFQQLNSGALGWIRDAADGFDDWATGLAATDGFQEFVDYLKTEGPQVADTLGDIVMAASDLVVAAAPLGGPTLRAVESLADAISLIADSPFGPILLAGASAMAALNLASRAFAPSVERARVATTGLVTDLRTMSSVGVVAWARTTDGALAYAAAAQRVKGQVAGLAKTGAGVAGLALATSDAASEAGAMNTALLATAGAMAGPWGAAIGGGIGVLLDWKAQQDAAAQSAEDFRQTLDAQTGAVTGRTRQLALDKLQQADWLENAQKAGVTADELARAVTEGGDAYDLVAAKIDNASSFMDFFTRDADDLKSNLRDMHGEVRKGAEEWEYLAPAAEGAASSLERASDATGHAAWQTQRLLDAQQKLNDFLTRRSSWRAYQASVDDARKALKENGRVLNEHSAKGRANSQAIDDMIRAAGEWSAKLKGSQRERFATQARKDILSAARDMGATKTQIDNIKAALKALDGTKARTTVINTVITEQKRVSGVGGPINPDAVPRADGGTVPGQRYPYGDRTLILAAPGEEIITNRNGEADRFRADRAAGRIPRYADGGTVAGSPRDRAPISDLGRAASESARAMREETSERVQAMRQRRQEIAEATGSNFMSDLFGSDQNPWSSGGGFTASLRGDIRNIRAFRRSLRKIKGKGVDGAALAAIAESGDVASAAQLAAMSRSRLRQYEVAFNTRAREAASLGQYAAQAATSGADMRGVERRLDRVEKAIDRSAKNMARELKSATQSGMDRGRGR